MLNEKFKKGINVGGWLAQYELIAKQPLTHFHLQQHFDTFLTKKDIQQIASWHFDHIRLPISGYLLYDTNLDILKPEILSYVRNCIEWCNGTANASSH
jgi:aryl-phospho-beta-D-glucosidase BglC (GH1 family)